MLKRIVLLSSLLVTSMTAHAGLIQYGDYKRDSASNIVTGGGLEWLKWDVTKGMSIDAALASFASQGWRLASNDEMASMYNRFGFGKTDWHANESAYQPLVLPWSSVDVYSPFETFIRLFGRTNHDSCSLNNSVNFCYSDDDPFEYTNALFGSDKNLNSKYNIASVVGDYTLVETANLYDRRPNVAVLHEDKVMVNDRNPYVGIALVRNSVPDKVTVPTPGSIGLLALGLVALGYRRRHGLGR